MRHWKVLKDFTINSREISGSWIKGEIIYLPERASKTILKQHKKAIELAETQRSSHVRKNDKPATAE